MSSQPHGRGVSTPRDLEQLRKRAKELVRAHRRGEAAATERLRAAVPRLARLSVPQLQASRLALADAQHTIAVENGFASWSRLRRGVELERDAVDGLVRAALAGEDGFVREASARHPAAAARSLHLACALADVEAVRVALETRPEAVDARWGPLDAPPLVYACAGRVGRGRRAVAERRIDIARRLLAHGADPNASYRDLTHFDGERVVLSAAAKHVGAVELLRTLVEAGADPGDHSALWATAAPERPSVDEDALASLKYLVSLRPDRWKLSTALSLSVRSDSAEGVELLLAAGADPNTGSGWGGSGTLLHHAILLGCQRTILERLFDAGDPTRRDRRGLTPLEVARRIGHAEAQRLLRERGVTAPPPSRADAAIAAALAGDEARLRELTSPGTDPIRFTREDHAVLFWALEHGRADSVRNLLRIGLDATAVGDDGRSALTVAQAQEGPEAEAAARLLAAAGATLRSFDEEVAPDSRTDDFEAAAQAVVEGDLATLERLLDDEPELIRWRSPRGHRATLLHYLGANGLERERQGTPPNAVEVCRFLLARGAEPDALAATYGGGTAQTTLALLASSDWPKRAGLQRELVLTLCAGGADPNGVEDDGVPLATAIGFSCLDAMAGLVEAGARVDNVLFAAALGRVDLVDADVESGGRLRAGAKLCPVDWFAPSADPVFVAQQALVQAASFDRRDVVRLLLSKGVDIGAAPKGETALHAACYAGHVEQVRELLEAGADAHVRDARYDSTAFGWALEGERFDVIDVLRAHTTPSLYDAVDIGLVEETRGHLERDPSQVDAPDGRGGLLLWSARRGRLAMVELLLAFGADRTVKDRAGKTPLELAEAGGHTAVAERLARDD